ncbi:MAG: T9SS type A sorting domain-containing protein [Aureispira sp.]
MKTVYLSIVLLYCCWSTGWAQTTNEGHPKSWTEKTISQQIDQRNLPKFDLAAQQQADAINDASWAGPWRFGFKHLVQYALQNSGTWTSLTNGDRVWRLGVRSKGALTMNVLFDDFYLPEGATLYLYNPITKELRGAYTAANNNIERTLGSTLIGGDELVLEYHEPASVRGQGALKVGAVIHGYRTVNQFPRTRLAKGLNDAGDCNHDVACPLGTGWQDQINSVAMIVVNGNGVCTGALVNNTNSDGTPYFLSANHCGTNVSTWVFRFNWDSPVASCAQTTLSQTPTGPFNEVNGAILRANNGGSDFSLLELNTIPTGAIYYAGWDRGTTPPTQTTGIHHPMGDVKKICRDDDPAVVTNFGGASVWEVTDWDQGVTEPASSGSPLFNQNQLIIGQLYGGGAACTGTNDNGQDDNYGRFDVSWDGSAANRRLRDWLDPSGSNVMVQAGYDPNGIVSALDAGLLQVQDIKDTYCNTNTISPTITLRNFGTTTLTSVEILYNVDGGPSTTYNWTGSLASQSVILVSLPTITVGSGSHTFNASANLPNNGVDGNTANNAIAKTFDITLGTAVNYFLAMDCYGSEITWTLADSATGTVLYSDGPYNDNFNTVDTIITEFCLPVGCYEFTIMDNYGDGLDGSSGICGRTGDYWITDANGTESVRMNAVNGDFGNSATHYFCITELGVNTINLANSFKVFPNPAQDQLSIQLDLPQTADVTVVLYNATGQVLQQLQRNGVNKESLELDLSSYGAGLYLVALKTGEQVITKKVVKQ